MKCFGNKGTKIIYGSGSFQNAVNDIIMSLFLDEFDTCRGIKFNSTIICSADYQ